jgi:thiamine pyrophosphate-dependent acetolactate synthase large subunit-like protein
MTLKVADALVETAVRAGVERVYGVIGDSLNPVGDAIRRDGRLRWFTSATRRSPRSRLVPRLSSRGG